MNRANRDVITHAVRHWGQLALQVVLGLVLFGALLIIAHRTNVRFDMTPDQRYVLSQEARQIVEAISEPVRITIFVDGQQTGLRQSIEDRLQRFTEASTYVSYEILDLDRHPREAERYGVSSYNTGVIKSDRGQQRLRATNQASITQALLKLTREHGPSVCFVTGHSEHSPDSPNERTGYSQVGKDLERENYVISSIDLVPAPGSEIECDVLVLAGPRLELLEKEVDYLIARLAGGGATLFLFDPEAPRSTERFLERVGIRAFDDLVVDERSRFYGADSFMPRVRIVDSSMFGSELGDAMFSVARTIRPSEGGELDASIRLLATSGQATWARLGETNVADHEIEFRRGIDKRGPLPLGLLIRGKQSNDTQASSQSANIGPMIVFGDSDFADNLHLNLFGNRDLFLSSIAFLAKQNVLVGRRKTKDARNFSVAYLTQEQMSRVFWIAVVYLPGGTMLLGVLVTTWRRRRASAHASV